MNKLKRSILLTALLAVGCVAMTGCTGLKVPANQLEFKTGYGSLSLKHPHNTVMNGVELTFATNGTVTAKIASLSTSNDPAVLTSEAAGEVAKINAVGEQVAAAFTAGGKAAGAAAGAIIKTP